MTDTTTADSEPGQPLGLALTDQLGPNAPKLTIEQVCKLGFAVLRAHNDDRLWRALTYDSGPYDLTTPNLALQELGAAFYAAGYAEAPKTTTKVEVSSDPEMVRRTLRAEAEVALLRAALTLPENATEPMQKAMQRAVLLRKSMNEVWRAALSELGA